jgi:hypothetical protein
MILTRRQLLHMTGALLLVCLSLLALYSSKSIWRVNNAQLDQYPRAHLALDNVPTGTWLCTGQGRSQSCVMTNLCISSSLGKNAVYGCGSQIVTDQVFSFSGDFLVADDDDELQDHPPEINLINANKEADRTWQPKLIKRSQLSSQHIQHYTQTIFVYGLYAPFHLAHMLTNGLIPLYQ